MWAVCWTPKCEKFNKCNKARLLILLTTNMKRIIDSCDAKCENGLKGGGLKVRKLI